jgi:hypothetical protein
MSIFIAWVVILLVPLVTIPVLVVASTCGWLASQQEPSDFSLHLLSLLRRV